MSTKSHQTIYGGSGNVFADLGFEHPEEVTAHFEQTD
jgi:hypothetical protein